jgi:butyryl-CoA dehydrogenase
MQQQIREDMIAGLSNATAYLDVFGRVVVGWIWLRQALVASRALQQGAEGTEATFYQGKLHAAQYFMDWELANIPAIAKLLTACNLVAHEMQNDWF